MHPAASFFLLVLAMQAVFTTAVVLLVGRRYPAKLGIYRWVAPAAVPILLFVLVSYAFVQDYRTFLSITQRSFDATMLVPIGRFAIAYGILWLIGVLLAGILIRFVLRRR